MWLGDGVGEGRPDRVAVAVWVAEAKRVNVGLRETVAVPVGEREREGLALGDRPSRNPVKLKQPQNPKPQTQNFCNHEK